MFGFRVIKELKRKLKRRRPVWSLGMLAALFLAAAAAGIGTAAVIGHAAFDVYAPAEVDTGRADSAVGADNPVSAPGSKNASRDAALQALAAWTGDVEIILHRVYWCGDETRMLGRHPADEAAELLKSRREWDASFDLAGRVMMEETVDELSPACRDTAYIAMDADGNLSLFDGPPRKDNVIRTFFQLDVRSLESSLSKERLKELAEGIRVSDKDEYNSVLSSFSDFAYRKSKGVMNPHP